MQISLRPEARIDIYDAARFYDRQSDGLGDKFIESIFGDLDRLECLVGIHSRRGRYFRIFSQKFPYIICYDRGDAIIVVGVLSCRMLPDSIDSTLDER
jgi:hypothetical protein